MAKSSDKISATELGQRGVIVDLNPLELTDNDLTQAQNWITEEVSGRSSIRKRPGLVAITVDTAEGIVLGGADLPVQDYSSSTRFLFIGRGPTT